MGFHVETVAGRDAKTVLEGGTSQRTLETKVVGAESFVSDEPRICARRDSGSCMKRGRIRSLAKLGKG